MAGNGTSLRFEVTATGELIEGGVYHGSQLVAHISDSPEGPVFTDAATGEPLTAEQLESLGRVFHAVDDMFELAERLFPGE